VVVHIALFANDQTGSASMRHCIPLVYSKCTANKHHFKFNGHCLFSNVGMHYVDNTLKVDKYACDKYEINLRSSFSGNKQFINNSIFI